MTGYVRICRDCGEEYRPQAVRCADCGGELEDRQLDEHGNPMLPEGAPSEPEGAPEPVAVEGRVVFVTPRAAELVPLMEALAEADIEYHVAEQPTTREGAARYALLVAEPDAAAALTALAPLVAPDEEHDGLHAVESRFEAGRYLACPACGAPQPPAAVECAECGLRLGSAEED